MERNLCDLKKYIYTVYIMKRKLIFHSILVAPLPFLLVAAGPLLAQTAMKWSAVLSAKPSRFWAGDTAGLFVSLASFDYQRLSAEYLWHHAHSWKRLSEWDDSGRNVTQKYPGTHHILPASGWESSDLQRCEETHNCVLSVYPERGWEGQLECRGYQICKRRMQQLSWNENMAINQVGVRGMLTHQWHNPVIENIPILHECALTTKIHTHFLSFLEESEHLCVWGYGISKNIGILSPGRVWVIVLREGFVCLGWPVRSQVQQVNWCGVTSNQ